MTALAPVLVTPPAILPITMVEAKEQLRVMHNDRDDLIRSLITAATEYLDGWSGILGRAIITQTWRQDFDGFCEKLRLPLGPVASITSVTYFDGAGELRTVDANTYRLLADVRGPYVALQPSAIWPSSYARQDAVSVTFVAGADEAEQRIKAAIRLHVESLYFPDRMVEGTGSKQYAALIEPLRRIGV